MAALFLSHSSQDRVVAERVRERLQAEGFAALFIDFDPAQGIPPGRNWERELYIQLRKTDGVIFLASPASVASRWCFAEVALARSLNKPVFPLRLQAGERLGLLDDVQEVDLADGEQAFGRLWAGLRRFGLDPGGSFAWDPGRPPYPGLAAFTSEDAAVFFGREDKTDELLQRLQPILQRGANRFLLIVGPSGSGKSSLLHAGLIPRLTRLQERWLLLPPLVPGNQPTKNLARSLAQAFALHGDRRSAAELEQHLLAGPAALVELAGELIEATAGNPNVLVVVDQAEELLTLTGDREQQAFLRLIHDALGDDSPLWAVATMRSEFLSRTPERAGLTEEANAVVVEPLSRVRLPQVIQQPARRAGLDFEPGLVERMVDDTTGGDALPLLAYTLRELYQRVGPEGTIRIADYEALGGVAGALRRRADQLVEELRRRGQDQLVLPTLLKLATIDREGEPIRRRVRRSVFDAGEQTVLQGFIDARLLISRKGSGGDVTIEVAHEALLRQWTPLHQAIEASRQFLEMRSEFEELTADWDRNWRDESYLLRGARLATFGEWADEHAGDLNELENQFLAASRTAAQQSYTRLRRLLVGLGILSVVAVVLAGLAVLSRREARHEARVALSRQLAAQATTLIDVQPDLALLLGVESLQVAPTGVEQDARDALAIGLTRSHHVAAQLSGHAGSVGDVAFSIDGRTLASTGGDATVRLWDLASGQLRRQPLRGHTARVRAVAFSPDGKTLASAADDRTVRLWDVASGQPQGQPFRGHTAGINEITFSPDGKTLASAAEDATVRLWDVASGRPRGEPLRGHTDWVIAVAFSPDGKTLASAGSDDFVRLWDVASGRAKGQPLRGHAGAVLDVAFSPDGRTLASGSEDAGVRLWDVASGRAKGQPLRSHTAWVRAIAFSPDGKTLASAADDATVQLWDVASGQPEGRPLRGHTAGVNDVAFSPDGKTLASGSGDTTVRLWRVEETRILGRPFRGHTAAVLDVAFSPDGRTLASGSEDATVRLWDIASGQPPRSRTLRGHESAAQVVALSPDGRTLASGSEDATVRLWDVASGQPRGQPLRGHTSFIYAVAFSPDGKTLASTGGDATVRLWDVASGKPRGTLRGHTDFVYTLAFSPDGRTLASGSEDATVRLWDAASGRPRGQPLRGHTDWVIAVAFSPDGRTLASGSGDATVRLWDVASGRPRGQPLRGHINALYDIAFSPDGKTLATTGGDATVRLWDVASGQLRGQPLRGHVGVVHDIAFSPDGRTLASVGDDASVRLWDVASGRPRGTLRGHTSTVVVVAFNPDGKMLASGSEDRTVRLWDLTTESWVNGACKIANRNLTRAEWNRFIEAGAPYEATCPQFPAPSA